MSFQQIKKEDTKRPEGKNCILIYGFDGAEVNKIMLFSKKKGLDKCIVANENSLDNIISNLINEDIEVSNNSRNAIKSSLILFNAVSNYELHHFIENFNELGIKKPLYAVVTKTSINWKLGDLLEELLREKKSFNKN
jgi:hypothetical protein